MPGSAGVVAPAVFAAGDGGGATIAGATFGMLRGLVARVLSSGGRPAACLRMALNFRVTVPDA
jgi:hypothetical protein